MRDPDWNGDPGGFAEIQIFPIEDEKAAEIAFEAGELDYTAVSVSSIPTFEANPPAGAKLVRKPSLAYVWLGMNTEARRSTIPRCARRCSGRSTSTPCSRRPISASPSGRTGLSPRA